MYLLNVTVKSANLIGPQVNQCNWYAVLKLKHVKSTTVTVKGGNPSWEQDFLFEVSESDLKPADKGEINNLNAGLIIEVWNKGMLWDKAVGYHFLHLKDIHPSNTEGLGEWLPLEAELIMRDGEVVGTRGQTGHAILIDARYELPLDTEGDEVELQRKLEMLNSMLDQEAKAEQARRQHQYYIQSGVSEDSDYTSDVNFPIGQNPNSSISQYSSYLTATPNQNQLATPQRSLNSSRENSYEKDEDYRNNSSSYYQSQYQNSQQLHPNQQGYPQQRSQRNNHQQQQPNPNVPLIQEQTPSPYWDGSSIPPIIPPGVENTETDPLYYNSRRQPPYKSYNSRRREETWETDGYGNYKQPSTTVEDPYGQQQQYQNNIDYNLDLDAQDYSQPPHNYAKRLKNNRRTTLGRQETLYDESGGVVDGDLYNQGTIPNKQGLQLESNINSQYNSNTSDLYSSQTSYQQNDSQKDPMSYQQQPYDTQLQYSEYGQDESAYYDQQDLTPIVADKANLDGYGSTYSDDWNNQTGDHYSTSNKYQNSQQLESQKSSSFLPISSTTNNKTHLNLNTASSAITSNTTTSSQQYNLPPSAGIPKIVTQEVSSSSTIYPEYTEDSSFYDEYGYPITSTTSQGPITTTTPATISQNQQVPSTTLPTDPSTDQYYDASGYENQTGYENWESQGYYDEAGNWITYDNSEQPWYYDESGNVVYGEYPYSTNSTNEIDANCTDVSGLLSHITTKATTTISSIADSTLGVSSIDSGTNKKDILSSIGKPSIVGTGEIMPSTTKSSVSYDGYDQYDNSTAAGDYYYNAPESNTGQMDYEYSIDDGSYYDDYGVLITKDGYGYPETTPVTTADSNIKPPIITEPSMDLTTTTTTTSNNKKGLQSQSSIDYNYAYQSEHDDSGHNSRINSVDRSNSITRRLSFRRQGRDYNIEDSTVPTTTIPSTTTGEINTTSTLNDPYNNYSKDDTITTTTTAPSQPHHPNLEKMRQDYSMSIDEIGQQQHWNEQQSYDFEQQYDEWGNPLTYDDPYLERGDSYEQYDEQIKNGDGTVQHMDSLESNTSEVKDPQELDKFEAQYWQKQQERIAQQQSGVSSHNHHQDSQDYYDSYDTFTGNKSSGLLEPVDSPKLKTLPNGQIPNTQRHDSFDETQEKDNNWYRQERQDSIDLKESLKKDLLRQMSIPGEIGYDDEDDEYLMEQEEEMRRRKNSLGSFDSANLPPTSPPLNSKPMQQQQSDEISDDALIQPPLKNEIDELLKSATLEVPIPKDKKTVSFDEEPPKIKIIDRVTKTMTPREKWLWSMNRICAMNQVSLFFPKISFFTTKTIAHLIYCRLSSHHLGT